jgi:ubiquinone/menaquinone biosynthesis C-methylase UbiE
MGEMVDFVTKLHKKTKRDYVSRMVDEKIHCMDISKQYGFDYWDGNRRYGYGGYKYDGRWKSVAEDMIKKYGLANNSKILDIGCGKAFLLYELKQLLPGAEIVGIDSSQYALENAKEEIKNCLFLHRAEDVLPFGDKQFDLVYSITTLHNLKVYDLKTAVSEVERVGKNGYIMVEAYRNSSELFNLECWALTCESFFRPDEWIWLYKEFGYNGDYEFIYFE